MNETDLSSVASLVVGGQAFERRVAARSPVLGIIQCYQFDHTPSAEYGGTKRHWGRMGSSFQLSGLEAERDDARWLVEARAYDALRKLVNVACRQAMSLTYETNSIAGLGSYASAAKQMVTFDTVSRVKLRDQLDRFADNTGVERDLLICSEEAFSQLSAIGTPTTYRYGSSRTLSGALDVGSATAVMCLDVPPSIAYAVNPSTLGLRGLGMSATAEKLAKTGDSERWFVKRELQMLVNQENAVGALLF